MPSHGRDGPEGSGEPGSPVTYKADSNVVLAGIPECGEAVSNRWEVRIGIYGDLRSKTVLAVSPDPVASFSLSMVSSTSEAVVHI